MMDYKEALLHLCNLGPDATDEQIAHQLELIEQEDDELIAEGQVAPDRATQEPNATPQATAQQRGLTEYVARLQARVKELETADLDRQADEFVKEHGPKVSDTAKLKARFVADPAGMREAFALVKTPEAKPAGRALGRDNTAQTPGDRKNEGTGDIARERKGAIAAIKARDNCSNAQATVRAQRENPALWKRE